jgi:hypothetical protein
VSDQRLRLFLDECCSSRLVDDLKEFFALDYPDTEIIHLSKSFPRGTDDSVWLSKIDPEWIVVTQDKGRAARNKLPLICQAMSITHVVFTAAVITSGYSVQKAALAACWEQLFLLRNLPGGTCVKLGLENKSSGVRLYHLRVNGKSLSAFLEEVK